MHDQMQACGRSSGKIVMPNSTRAAGILLLFESLVREKHNLVMYWMSNVKAKDLEDKEFYLVSQLCSVLFPIGLLVKLVQSDKPGAISYTLFTTIRTWMVYLTSKKYYVADTQRSSHSDDLTKWDSSFTFPPRTYKGVPITEQTSGKSKARKKKYIPLTTVKKEHLHPIAKKLIDRLITEMTKYGVKATDDRLLAMACNPLMATLGMAELDLMFAFMIKNASGYEGLITEMKIEHKEKAMEFLVNEIKSICSLIVPNDNNNGGEDGVVPADGGGAEDEEVDEYEAMRMTLAMESERVETSSEILDPVKSQVSAFFNQQFDPRSGMPLETHSLVGATKSTWIKEWDTVVEHFDIFKWWESIGKSSFPLIYPVAIRILSMPDSNGHQERTFSAATWMDGKLNARQNEFTFEMKVLLYKNQAFLEEFKQEVLEESKRAAAARTKALLAASVNGVKDSDIDDELEGWMDAFGYDDETD
jgi:hAT family C-terminal dimerisation region